jgi:hypothetical protein
VYGLLRSGASGTFQSQLDAEWHIGQRLTLPPHRHRLIVQPLDPRCVLPIVAIKLRESFGVIAKPVTRNSPRMCAASVLPLSRCVEYDRLTQTPVRRTCIVLPWLNGAGKTDRMPSPHADQGAARSLTQADRPPRTSPFGRGRRTGSHGSASRSRAPLPRAPRSP